MQCPRCHAENRDGLRFCEDCGTRLAVTCASCGAEVTQGKRFCGECGAPLGAAPAAARFTSPESYTPRHLAEKILTSKSALEGERKQVTVLFADLKGSMELLVDRDPEEARKILDPVLELMMEAVHKYEGTVNQVMGDGIMALFGAPVAHEDHAVRACLAGLRMQDAIRRHVEASARPDAKAVRIRVGLHVGVSAVRGFTRLIGREAEMAPLTRALARAATGSGQVVALVGEAGLGKSRIFWEFTRSDHARNWLVLEARPVSYGKAMTFLPVIDMLKAYFELEDRDEAAAARTKVAGKLTALDPTLERQIVPMLAVLQLPVDDRHWSALDPPQRRYRMLDAVKRLLIRQSEVRPLLLVFEDLHWIDSETQAFPPTPPHPPQPARIPPPVNAPPQY